MAVTSPASHTVTPGLRSARRIESHRSAPLSQWRKGARGRGKGHVACDSDGVRSTRRPRPPDGASRPSHTTSRPPRPLPVMPGLSPSSYRASVLRSLPVNDPFLRPPPGKGCLEEGGLSGSRRAAWASTGRLLYTYTLNIHVMWHTSRRQEGKPLPSSDQRDREDRLLPVTA